MVNNNMYKFFTENILIPPNQSGFKPGDSYITQLLSITHQIYKSFDDDLGGIFLQISKAFDKVSHKEIFHNLKTIKNYLTSSPIF